MFTKINFISSKLGATRTDVWELEALYKYVTNTLFDPFSLEYIENKFEEAYESLKYLLKTLYSEALTAS